MTKIEMTGEVTGVFVPLEEVEQTEKEFAELKIIAANRKAFIDWCAEHHEEILKEYTGF